MDVQAVPPAALSHCDRHLFWRPATRKVLDYAALGVPVLASDRAVFRGALADGRRGGWLLPDDENAWFVALVRLVRDVQLRHRLSGGVRAAFAAGTLAAELRAAWLSLVRSGAKAARGRSGQIAAARAAARVRYPRARRDGRQAAPCPRQVSLSIEHEGSAA
jgi:hypothetical protein